MKPKHITINSFLPYFLFSLCLIFGLITGTLAKEITAKEKEQLAQEEKYRQARKLGTIRIYPDITTNLSKHKYKHHQYIMLRIDLLASDNKYRDFINNNQPLFRDQLILFLNKQKVGNFRNKKRLRSIKKRIIKLINHTLYPEVHDHVIKGVIFNKMTIE